MTDLAPPRLAERLMARTLRSSLAYHGVIGDLREEYELRRARHSRLRCNLWFWLQSLSVFFRFRRENKWKGRTEARRGIRHLLGGALEDIRYAIRRLRKSPAFAVTTIATLALGIGATTAIFSLVNGVLLRPLPYHQPERLAAVWSVEARGQATPWTSHLDFVDWREFNEVFSGLVATTGLEVNITGTDIAERIHGARVSHGFFEVMGVPPILGRSPAVEEDQPGASAVVVLGHGLWQRHFGADSAIVGRTVEVHGVQLPVIGVAAPGFDFPSGAEFWMPLARNPNSSGRRQIFLQVVGRLKDGVKLARAQADMSAIARRLEEQYPATNTDWGILVMRLHDEVVGDVRPTLLVFLGSVGLVLLIVCANLANLMLMKAATRTNEIGIRAAIGASRGRLTRQLLTEAGVLALMGGGFGVLIAHWAVRTLVWANPGNIPRLDEAGIDPTVLVFALVVSMVTALLFGLAPTLQLSGLEAGNALGLGGNRATAGRGAFRFRSALIVSQVALALSLLVGAGLLMRTFLRLQAVDPGFDPASVVSVRLSLPGAQYAEAGQSMRFYDQLLQNLRALPGVASVGMASAVPLGSSVSFVTFQIPGGPTEELVTAGQVAHDFIASPDYFRTLGIPLVDGRGFAQQDRDDTEPVALITSSMARRFWAGQSPLGWEIRFLGDRLRVVGVVGDVHNLGLEQAPRPQIYRPYSQNPRRTMTIVVRSEQNASALVPSIRREIRALDASLPVSTAQMTELVAVSVAQPRFNLFLIGALAIAATLLAAVGIYGVMAYSVAARSREIGLRIALGASQWNIMLRVVGRAATLVALGAAIGVGLALLMTRLISRLLVGVSATEPTTYLVVVAVMGLVGGIAAFIPARRAAGVDPMEALRSQ